MCQDSGSLNGPGQTSIIMRMVSDLDIWRTANVIIKQYGQDAPIHAAMRADARCGARARPPEPRTARSRLTGYTVAPERGRASWAAPGAPRSLRCPRGRRVRFDCLDAARE